MKKFPAIPFEQKSSI